MRISRSSPLPPRCALTIVAMLAIALTACTVRGGSQAAATWVRQADSVLRADAPVANDLAKGGLDVLDHRADALRNLRKAAPQGQQPIEVATAYRKVELTLAANAQLKQVQRQAAADFSLIPAEASAIAAAATPYSDVRQKLSQLASSVLYDVTCDVTFSAVTNAEAAALEGAPLKAPHLVEPTLESIENHGRTEFARLFGRRFATSVDWVQYARSIYGKAIEKGDLDKDGKLDLDEKIVAPQWTTTRALVYYAKYCLQPPR